MISMLFEMFGPNQSEMTKKRSLSIICSSNNTVGFLPIVLNKIYNKIENE